jgi:hypothetical protein
MVSLWSSAAAAPVAGSAAAAYRTLFTTIRRLVVGRRLAIRLDAGELTLTVTEFHSRFDVRALSVGQLGEVRLAARDICWGETRFARASAVLHNVHVRPSVPPMLVAAPVELTVDVGTSVLDTLLAAAAPRLRAHVGSDGVTRLRLARHPRLGHLEIDGRLDGSTLWLAPRRVAMGRARWTLPARTPSYPLRLPDLPHGLRLTAIGFAPHLLRLEGTLPEWRIAMPRGRLEEILGQLGAAGRPLNLTRLWRQA